jgi:hypothetical protein
MSLRVRVRAGAVLRPWTCAANPKVGVRVHQSHAATSANERLEIMETAERGARVCEPHQFTATWAERGVRTGRHDGFPFLEAGASLLVARPGTLVPA